MLTREERAALLARSVAPAELAELVVARTDERERLRRHVLTAERALTEVLELVTSELDRRYVDEVAEDAGTAGVPYVWRHYVSAEAGRELVTRLERNSRARHRRRADRRALRVVS